MTRQSSSSNRRGVLLLIVLGMLAVFGLIVTTFLVVTSQTRRATLVEPAALQADPTVALPQKAVMQLLRGTSTGTLTGTPTDSILDRVSALEGHSLLEGVYGNRSIAGFMRNAGGMTVVAGPPFGSQMGGAMIAFTPPPVISEPWRVVGCVLTMTNGPSAGESTRIVAYRADTNQLIILGFDSSNSTAKMVGQLTSPPYPQFNYVINNAPFSGMGRSFNESGGGLDLAIPLNPAAVAAGATLIPPGPAALLPNTSHQASLTPEQLRLRKALGGANVDYTAPDYNTMLVALLNPNPTNAAMRYGAPLIPSLHRPEIVRYWINLVNPPTSGNPNDLSDVNPANPQSLTQRFIKQPPGSNWTAVDWKAFKRRLVLRPLPEDHPAFTGSNPKGAPADYQSGFNPLWDPKMNGMAGRFGYDVDNDGDGVPDSIWIDIGLEVITLPDGRLAKPLVAFLCVELDGRLNINTHGSATQTAAAYYANPTAPTGTLFAGGLGAAALPRGQGWGTADINLRPLFWPRILADPDDYDALSDADTVFLNLLKNRYSDLLGTAPGMSTRADSYSQNRLFSFWNDCASLLYGHAPGTYNFHYWNFLTNTGWFVPTNNPNGYHLNAYGSPPSFKAHGAVGLDQRGQPVYPNTAEPFEQRDNPYELDLSAASSGSTNDRAPDKPFSLGEFERIIRPFDGNSANLSRRLADTASPYDESVLVNRRHELTVESCDIPVAPAGLPREIAERLFAGTAPNRPVDALVASATMRDWYPPRSAQDVLAIKMFLDLRADGADDATTYNVVKGSLAQLMPLEMLGGLKMDLNRPFGNGLDDNGNGIVDEPAELLLPSPQRVPLVTNTFDEATQTFNPVKFPPLVGPDGVPLQKLVHVDVDGDNDIDAIDHALARQLYARHLYILALLAIDHRADPSNLTQEVKDRARMIAQWAVNVVDFMDRDSIMTPFEYDIAPFVRKSGVTAYGTGSWNVDGIVGGTSTDDGQPYRGLVWGCERPELLITETLTMHNRNTRDLSADGGTVAAGQDNNSDFDQAYPPEGSLFIEIYNPQGNRDPKTGEFYGFYNDGAPRSGVDLTKRVNPLDNTSAPVWRLAVYPTATVETTAAPQRTVYFIDAQNITVTNDGYRHYTQNPPGSRAASEKELPSDRFLLPGRYAVIGPGKTSNLTAGTPLPTITYFGFRSGLDVGDNSTRRISLLPYRFESNPTRPQVEFFSNGSADDLLGAGIQQPLAICIDRAGTTGDSRRLSVTEPTATEAYPNVDAAGNALGTNGQYTEPYGRPLDGFESSGAPRNASENLWGLLAQDGTHPNFRTLHLQRLADPTRPWDAAANPYITVDISPLDLITFNGATDLDEAPDPGNPPMDDTLVMSRERGNRNDTANANNLWTQEPFTNPDTAKAHVASVTGHNFAAQLGNTLGYLNWSLNSGHEAAGPVDAPAEYLGAPRGTPFPWLTWNNRPFASANELILVPAASPHLLFVHPDNLTDTSYPFDHVFRLPGTTPNPYDNSADLFPHLLNFYLWEKPTGDQGQPALLHRVLEYVRVPSLFEGSDIPLDPTLFAATSPQHIFSPPFHFLSAYREPGRINLNTLTHVNVFRGLLNRQDLTDGSTDGSFFPAFQLSRQWNGQSLGDIAPYCPTRFRRPFRGSAGNQLNPPVDDPANPGTPLLNGPDHKEEINWTLLRQTVDGPASRPTPASPMFTQPAGFSGEIDNPSRSPYFRHYPAMRLGNLVTQRSNVFAVWITVGMFEALPAPGFVPDPALPPAAIAIAAADHDAVYLDPSGARYTWGAEIGADTGEVKRRRTFFLIDRTIPAGFSRDYSIVGAADVRDALDKSAKQTILLQRDIE